MWDLGKEKIQNKEPRSANQIQVGEKSPKSSSWNWYQKTKLNFILKMKELYLLCFC